MFWLAVISLNEIVCLLQECHQVFMSKQYSNHLQLLKVKHSDK
jgi:hypothetical protein